MQSFIFACKANACRIFVLLFCKMVFNYFFVAGEGSVPSSVSFNGTWNSNVFSLLRNFLSKGTMIRSESSFMITRIIHGFYSCIISYLFWKLAPKIFHCAGNSPEHIPFTNNPVFYRSLLIWTLHWTQLPQLESNLWFSPLYGTSVSDT